MDAVRSSASQMWWPAPPHFPNGRIFERNPMNRCTFNRGFLRRTVISAAGVLALFSTAVGRDASHSVRGRLDT